MLKYLISNIDDMLRIALADLEGLGWKPKHYVKIDGVRYGYDKCAPDELALPNAVVDLVKVQANHVIPDHYHAKGRERFSVLGGRATLQTRFNDEDPRDERLIEQGYIFTIEPGERHRVENIWDQPLYLFRIATPGKDSIFTEHPDAFK